MASRSPLVQALMSLPGSLHSTPRQSFVQAASPNPPGAMNWGESPQPHSSRQSFTGATAAQPLNVVHPQMPDTFQAPESPTIRALLPSAPAAPVPTAPPALVAAVNAEQPAAAAPTGVGAPGGATLAPNPPVPAAAAVLPNGAPAWTGPTNLTPTQVAANNPQSAPVGIDAGGYPAAPAGLTSNLIAQYAQLGKRLNPSVGSSRTSFRS